MQRAMGRKPAAGATAAAAAAGATGEVDGGVAAAGADKAAKQRVARGKWKKATTAARTVVMMKGPGLDYFAEDKVSSRTCPPLNPLLLLLLLLFFSSSFFLFSRFLPLCFCPFNLQSLHERVFPSAATRSPTNTTKRP